MAQAVYQHCEVLSLMRALQRPAKPPGVQEGERLMQDILLAACNDGHAD